ncbi:MAG: multiheme c-type cytochrome [bacterium]
MGTLRAALATTASAAVALCILQSVLAQEPPHSPVSIIPAALPNAPAEPIAAAGKARYTGTGSCSAVACHGGVGRKDCADGNGGEIWRSEYTVWITDDPHSRAFSVLFNDTAKTIARNMAGGGKMTEAWQDVRCLACHSLPRSEAEFAATEKFNADGVGCESCHGPAGNWLNEHTTASWKLLDPATKEQNYQFRNTKNLVSRTETCLGCHLGKRSDADLVDRDMNHDMVAAGHPRLNFEMAAFSDLHPNHWCEKPQQWNETQSATDASFRNAWLWATGKLVTAAAGLELSAARADTKTAPWPEFSETNCYSCHQALTADPVRLKKPGELPGRPVWGTWFLSDLDPLTTEKPGLKTELDSSFRKLMQSPLPSRGKATESCRTLAKSLRSLAIERNNQGLTDSEMQLIITKALNQPIDPLPKAWDTDAQNFLALSAMARTHRGKNLSPSLSRQIDLLKSRLQTQPEVAPAQNHSNKQ